LASGIDEFEIFAEKTTQDAGLPLRELVVDIIRKGALLMQGAKEVSSENKAV
jgi:hypothetical protein